MPPPQPLNLPPLRAVPPQNHATLRTSFLRLLAALAFCNNDNETAAALPLSLARLACFGARAPACRGRWPACSAPQLRGFCHIEPQRRRALVPAFKGYGSGTGNIAFSADGTTFARGHHLSNVVQVFGTASGALHSEASLHPYFQITPFADGFLVACGEVLHRCDAHGAVTGVAIVCRNLILGICIVGTQLAFSAFQGGFIGITALDAICWHVPHVHGLYSEAWRAAVYA
jgi:hypothetical protein